jgi:hypothetical protein
MLLCAAFYLFDSWVLRRVMLAMYYLAPLLNFNSQNKIFVSPHPRKGQTLKIQHK